MSTISASTTSTTAYKVTADTTGTLVFQTGASPTTAMTLGSDQSVTFAGTPTYSGGTANGVAYLNGSKVLTTGTSLVYNGSNLRVGGTPSSWGGANYGSLEIGPGAKGLALTSDSPAEGRVVQNAYYNGTNWIYNDAFGATNYRQTNGIHAWFTAPTGTAGATATFTEYLRLDNSGNLNLNTTGAFGKFCADIGALSFTASNSGSSLVWGTSSTSGRPSITVASTGSGQDSALRVVVSPDNGSTWLGWTNGINIETGSNTLSWCINGSANPGRVFSSGGVAMRLTTGGALSTSTGSLGTISDIRMKKDVVDATPKLDQLMQLRVVNYVLIDDPEERKMLGFVAQEVEQVFAGLIEEHDILDPDTKEVTMHQKTVKTTVLIPMLVKAMQEQQAIIETLTNRITALEAK